MDSYKGLGIDGMVEVNPKEIISIKSKGTYSIVYIKDKEEKKKEIVFYVRINNIMDALQNQGINYVKKTKDKDGHLVVNYI